MKVWQAGSHLSEERGAEVRDWSWRRTRRRLGLLVRLTLPYRGRTLLALGTLLGPGGIVMAFLYSAIAGGLLAVGHAVGRGRFGTTVSRTARLMRAPSETKKEIDGAARASRFAYGPALAAGAIAAALLVK